MAKTEINVYGPADTDAEGILTQWIQQPVSNSPAENANGEVTYTEKFKGPYFLGKEILQHIKVGDKLNSVHLILEGQAGIVSRYTTPTCPRRSDQEGTWQWELRSVNVEELQFGDHCLLILDFVAVLVPPSSNSLQSLEKETQWSVSWQSYTVTPYEFFSGKLHDPIPVSLADTVPTPDWSLPASRVMIENFYNYNGQLLKDENDGTECLIYHPNQGCPEERYALSPAEQVAMTKINLQRNCVWHYPIVIKRTVKVGEENSVFDEELGPELDTITELPNDCPYTFAKVKTGKGDVDLTWLKIGDDITSTKVNSQERYERREMWAGYTEVDINYYGKQTFAHTEDGILSGRWYKNCL